MARLAAYHPTVLVGDVTLELDLDDFQSPEDLERAFSGVSGDGPRALRLVWERAELIGLLAVRVIG